MRLAREESAKVMIAVGGLLRRAAVVYYPGTTTTRAVASVVRRLATTLTLKITVYLHPQFVAIVDVILTNACTAASWAVTLHLAHYNARAWQQTTADGKFYRARGPMVAYQTQTRLFTASSLLAEIRRGHKNNYSVDYQE